MGWTEPPTYADGPCIIHVRPPNTVLEDEDRTSGVAPARGG
jgi:hypothetical protein